jgi:hypothetical protein
MYFNLEFSVKEIKVKVMRETRGQRFDPGSSTFAPFLGYYLFNIIKISSISRIQILRHIPFFKLTSEYLEYFL